MLAFFSGTVKVYKLLSTTHLPEACCHASCTSAIFQYCRQRCPRRSGHARGSIASALERLPELGSVHRQRVVQGHYGDCGSNTIDEITTTASEPELRRLQRLVAARPAAIVCVSTSRLEPLMGWLHHFVGPFVAVDFVCMPL